MYWAEEVWGWDRGSICAQNFHPCTIHALATREKKKEHWRSNFVKLSPFPPPPPLFLASPLAAPLILLKRTKTSVFSKILFSILAKISLQKNWEKTEMSFVRPRPWKRMPTAGGLYLPWIPRSIFKSVKRPRTLVSQNVAQLVLEATLRFPHVARRRNNYRILGWTSPLARRRERKEHFPQNHIWRLFPSPKKPTPPLLINASLRREASFPTQGGKSGKRKMTLCVPPLACFNFANPAPLFLSAPKTFRGNGFNSCYRERKREEAFAGFSPPFAGEYR